MLNLFLNDADFIDFFVVMLFQRNDLQDGETPLHRASYRGRLPVVEALLCGGADWSIQNKVGL